MPKRPLVAASRLVGLALLLLAFAWPSSAVAKDWIELLAAGLREPTARLGPGIDSVLLEHQVGTTKLGTYLETLRFEGCLDLVRDDLTDGLDRLRMLHVAAVESSSIRRVWRTWERRLDGLSHDSYLLVTTWLDSPETARRLFLCDDQLPRSWRQLEPAAFVLEAVTWFDIALAEREHSIHKGVAADRELAIMQLIELRIALQDRFDMTYAQSLTTQRSRDQLQRRLQLMWDILLEPFHRGFSPRGRLGDPEPDKARKQRARFSSPTGGIQLPDPRELAVRDRVVQGWTKQRAVIDRDIKANEDRLQLALANLLNEQDPALRDRAVREAARFQAELDHSLSDLERMQNRIYSLRTGRSYVDSMLDRGFRRRAVRKLSRRSQRLATQRDRIEGAVSQAIERGAADPAAPPITPPSLRPVRDLNTPGPGNWLAGLAQPDESRSRTTATEPTGIETGSGWVERIYEGPLPTPSATWSDDLVLAISKRHVGLDETDVRIMLGLVQLAYKELPGRAAVEQAVWRSLAQGDGLRIRGEETSLSELWQPGLSHAEQPAVTFILTLYF